ncbi:proline-rich protein 2-like [Dermochelys coriacea]|uniref:proline-rich protein 2-like n=1 Tax=Dermochelys coriacea TaxID=27794 RepID=UPI0018E86E37|nr:proline-rich protein 2-like [Dermochelys coriacea]
MGIKILPLSWGRCEVWALPLQHQPRGAQKNPGCSMPSPASLSQGRSLSSQEKQEVPQGPPLPASPSAHLQQDPRLRAPGLQAQIPHAHPIGLHARAHPARAQPLAQTILHPPVKAPNPPGSSPSTSAPAAPLARPEGGCPGNGAMAPVGPATPQPQPPGSPLPAASLTCSGLAGARRRRGGGSGSRRVPPPARGSNFVSNSASSPHSGRGRAHVTCAANSSHPLLPAVGGGAVRRRQGPPPARSAPPRPLEPPALGTGPALARPTPQPPARPRGVHGPFPPPPRRLPRPPVSRLPRLKPPSASPGSPAKPPRARGAERPPGSERPRAPLAPLALHRLLASPQQTGQRTGLGLSGAGETLPGARRDPLKRQPTSQAGGHCGPPPGRG